SPRLLSYASPCHSTSPSMSILFFIPLPPISFFLIIRPPPSSTLFPYTTLFRSDLAFARDLAHSPARPDGARPHRLRSAAGRRRRSEEHTSELQSLTNLVCRLLLEKKKDPMHSVPELITYAKANTGQLNLAPPVT